MITAVPVPFITAFLLVLLAGANHHQLKHTATGLIFASVLYINALSMLCIGFRWSLGIIQLLPVAAGLTVVSAALLYLAFKSLGRSGAVMLVSRDWPHLIALGLIIVSSVVEPRWIEVIVIVTKLFYAGLLMRLARKAPNSLQLVKLNLFRSQQHALWAVAASLLISVCIDLAIVVDFTLHEGLHSARLVGIANLFIVVFLGWACVKAGQGKGGDSVSILHQGVFSSGKNDESSQLDSPAQLDDSDRANEDERKLLVDLNALLVEQELYKDTDLNL